jgi:hypothetical protein
VEGVVWSGTEGGIDSGLKEPLHNDRIDGPEDGPVVT